MAGPAIALRRLVVLAVAAGLGAGVLAALPAAAALDCSDERAVAKLPLHEGGGAAEAGTFANPWINRHHVYCGDINRRGKAVGFHYRQGGSDPLTGPGNNNPAAARITGAIRPEAGEPGWRIYRGEGIEIWSGERRGYVRKNGFSTFFPDNCTPDEVMASIRHAVAHASRIPPKGGGRFSGQSGPSSLPPGYCYRRDAGEDRPLAFRISSFLNKLRGAGWTINTAYPD